MKTWQCNDGLIHVVESKTRGSEKTTLFMHCTHVEFVKATDVIIPEGVPTCVACIGNHEKYSVVLDSPLGAQLRQLAHGSNAEEP